MDKRFSQRKSGKILAAAAASVGLAGFASQHANAGLVIDVRAIGVSAGGTLNSGKDVTAAPGVTVTMGVYARISGTNATQNIGDLDGNGDANDTQNDDSLNIVTGSYTSTGLLAGNLSANAAGQGVNYNTRVAPFNGPGSINGIGTDFDSDGDLDIGAVGTDPTNMFVARAAATTFAALQNGNTKAYNSGSFTANTDETIIDPTTSELRIGTLRFVVAGSSGSTGVNFLQRPTTDAGSALWFEDGIATGKTPGTGSYTVGAPVLVSVPEPATLGLLGIAGLGMLARRRENKNA
jgi:PEP-CTERM motif